MSSDAGSSTGRPSDSTDKVGDTDTSFTSTDSSEQAAVDRFLQLVGKLSDRKLNRYRNLFKAEPPNPHLKELAKLRTYPNNHELEWKKANEEAQKQVEYVGNSQDSYLREG